MSQKDLWTTEPGSMWTNPPHIYSTTKSTCKPSSLLPRHPCASTLFLLFHLQPTHSRYDIYPSSPPPLSLSPRLSFSSSALPPGVAPSDVGQDAVDKQGHDGGAEQAGHRHRDKPRQEDVPEEAPVHCFLGADPTHSHNWAHLEAAARREERKIISSSTEQNVQRSKAKVSIKSYRLSTLFSWWKFLQDCFAVRLRQLFLRHVLQCLTLLLCIKWLIV